MKVATFLFSMLLAPDARVDGLSMPRVAGHAQGRQASGLGDVDALAVAFQGVLGGQDVGMIGDQAGELDLKRGRVGGLGRAKRGHQQPSSNRRSGDRPSAHAVKLPQVR